jgi:hypothetical protein
MVRKFTTSTQFMMVSNTLIKRMLRSFILTRHGDLTSQLQVLMVSLLLLLQETFADLQLLADVP